PLQAQLRAAWPRAVLRGAARAPTRAVPRAHGARRRRRRRRVLSRVSARCAVMRLLAVPLALLAFHTSIQPLPKPVRAELNGPFWHQGCPVRLSQLRLLTVTYRDFDGGAQTGQLVVNEDAAPNLAR